MKSTSSTRRPIATAAPAVSVFFALWVLAALSAGWGILTFTPVKVSAGALGAICIMLAAWKVEAALYVTGFFLVVLQEAETTPGTFFTFLEWLNKPNIPSTLEVLFAVVIAAFFLRSFLTQVGSYGFEGMRGPLALFFLLLFIALANGIASGTDSTFRKEDFKRFIFPVLLFVSAFNILDTRQKILRVFAVMFWVMLAKCYLADFYYLQGLGFPYGDQRVVFLESGDQTLVVTILIVGMAFLAERRMGWRSLPWMLLGGGPVLFALIFSYRRNAMWGALFSLALLVFLSQREKKVRLVKVVAGAGLGAFLLMTVMPTTNSVSTGEFIQQRLASVLDRHQDSNTAHMNEWVVTVQDTMPHPFFGLGLGSIHSPVPDFEVINRHTVHNALLMLWMKMGGFALLLFIWCLYRYCRVGAGEALRHRDPLLTGLFATFGLWVIAMNVGPSWYYYRESCLMALIMAVVGRLAQLGPPATGEAPGRAAAARDRVRVPGTWEGAEGDRKPQGYIEADGYRREED
jgi:hypothetical protein